MKKKFLFIPLLAFTLAACGKNPAPAPTEGVLHFYDGIHEHVTWNGQYDTSLGGLFESGCVAYFRGNGCGLSTDRAFKQVKSISMTIKELEVEESDRFGRISCYLTEVRDDWTDNSHRQEAAWSMWEWQDGQATHFFDYTQAEYDADKSYYVCFWLAGNSASIHWQVLDLKITFALE